ncbi:MAG: ABC transporter substrate-binding protein [Phycisphaerales bacterium]
MKDALMLPLLSLRHLSIGVWIILGLLLLSGAYLLTVNDAKSDDLQMWVFSPEHKLMYEPMIEELNAQTQLELDADSADQPKDIKLTLLSIAAIQSRMTSGFFGGLPTADLIEVERSTVGKVFMGPPESIGFRDITDRLKAEGLYDQINAPSLSPWSVDGRVYGLPHDVHPVMLAYRADLTEAAGIDLTQATTWSKFFELLEPLMGDEDGNGRPDHYPMSMWVTQQDNIELLLLQGGGQLFDEQGRPTVNSDRNTELLAEILSWCIGDRPLVTDIDEFSAAGHQARVDGEAIAYLCPDWMCSIWKMHVPLIGGKMKLMPLPAFEEGGRRTSVRGGTMLGFPKESVEYEQSWDTAVQLYTSPEIARDLYQMVDIVSPIRSLWSDPVYDEPDPFFMDQAKGRMFIELAPEIPLRTSSPYNYSAVLTVRDAAVNILNWSNSGGGADMETLLTKTKEELDGAQRAIERQMSRNAFMEVSTP